MNAELSNTESVMEEISTEKSSLERLHEFSKEIQKECKDFMVREVSDRNMIFIPDRGSLYFKTGSGKYEYGMSRFSMGQLCTKLEVPSRYIETCIRKGELELASQNVNTWLAQYERDLFVRTHKNKVRGILSNRYMTLDAPEIIETLIENVPEQFEVKGHYLTSERFHCRIVNKAQMTKKEDLFAGLQIDSSDVGRSMLTVTFFIFKLVCTNGMVAPVKGGVFYSQKHIGKSADELDEFKLGFKEAMKRLPEVEEEYFNLIENAREQKMKLKLEELKNMLLKSSGLNEKGVEGVLQKINAGQYDNTWWGVINAVTEASQMYTLERRLEIERAAGNMLMNIA